MASGNRSINPTKTANTPAIVSTAGDVLAENDNRNGFMIQNVGTNPLFIRLATGASSTVFHVVLKGGDVASDGMGGSFSLFDCVYKGVVSVAGTTLKCVITEL